MTRPKRPHLPAKAEPPPPAPNAASRRFAELGDFRLDPASVRLLSRRWCEENRVVVLGAEPGANGDALAVGLLDPSDAALLDEIAQRLGRTVRPVQLNDWEVGRALAAGFGDEGADAGGWRLELEPPSELSFEPDAPVTDLVDEILGKAVHAGASDVHIEVYEDDVDVRFRVDGLLEHVATALSPANVAAVVSRLKILGRLDIAEKRTAQDGRILATFEEGPRRRKIDFRLSVVPGPFGEDAVLRILDSDRPAVSLPELGFSGDLLGSLERLIANPEGMLLVAGPTGSGKTTTLYAALSKIQTRERKILTVEDPIEYGFAKINQKQVGPKMSFADYARAFLRQNPDVILVGEVRDEETADAAFRAAQTGHLVLSTIHAPDSVRTLSRLRTLGIDPNLMAASLLGVLSQRILRKLCPACRREQPATDREGADLALAAGDGPFFGAPGCDACGGRGYRGRVAVAELFVPDEELADLVAAETPVHEIRARARAKGLRSLVEDALDKARAGTTSLSELLRAIPRRLIESDRG